MDIHRVSEKNVSTYLFCSVSVKCERISTKIGRHVPKKLNKTKLKMSTSPKICASNTLGNLKSQTEPSTH